MANFGDGNFSDGTFDGGGVSSTAKTFGGASTTVAQIDQTTHFPNVTLFGQGNFGDSAFGSGGGSSTIKIIGGAAVGVGSITVRAAKTFGGKSSGVASFIASAIIPGVPYGSGPYGAGPYGGGVTPPNIFGGIAVGVGGASKQQARVKTFGGIAVGVVSENVAKSFTVSKIIGGRSAGENSFIIGSTHLQHGFGANGAGVGSLARSSSGAKSFGGTSAGVGGATKAENAAKAVGAISAGIGGSGIPHSFGPKTFGGVSAGVATITRIGIGSGRTYGAVGASYGDLGMSYAGIGAKTFGGITPAIDGIVKSALTVPKTVGGVSIGISSIVRGNTVPKTVGGVSAGVGGATKAFAEAKTLGGIGVGIANITKASNAPKVIGGTSVGVTSIARADTVAKIVGAIGVGVSGVVVIVRTVSKSLGGVGDSVGGQTRGAVSNPKVLGAIGDSVGGQTISGVHLTINKSVGGISACISSIDRQYNVPRTTGAISSGISAFTITAQTVSKAFGAISVGTANISFSLSATKQGIFGGVGVGVGGTQQPQLVILRSLGASSTGISNITKGSVLITKPLGGFGVGASGILIPAKKTIGAVLVGVGGSAGVGVHVFPRNVGAAATGSGGFSEFVPSAQRIKSTGFILNKPNTGRLVVV